MATGTPEIQFPLGGLNRRAAYQSQPPYTSVNLVNVRPIDTFEKRVRGGSRPMLSKEYSSLVGSAADEIRMLGVVNGVAGQAIPSSYTHTFTGADDDPVDAAVWDTPAGYVSHKITSNMAAKGASTSFNVLKASEIADLDTSKTHTLKCKFVIPGSGVPCAHAIYARLDDTTPDRYSNGVLYFVVSYVGGAGAITVTGAFQEYGSAATSNSFDLPAAGTYYMSIRIDSNSATWYVQDSTEETTYWTDTAFYNYAGPGNRFGFVNSSSTGLMDDFSVEYYTENATLANTLVAWSKDALKYSVSGGTLTAATLGSLTLGTDKLIQCVDRAGTLYIADTDNNAHYGAGTLKNIVAGDGIDRLQWSGATYTNYNANDYRVEILVSSNETEVPIDQYAITSVDATNGIQLDGVTVTDDRTVTFKIARSAKKMSLSDHTLSVWTATAGSVPLGSEQLCRYRDSMVFSNFPEAPHMSVMSRAGDPDDWDFGADEDDVGRAIVITNTQRGDIGEPIMATVPGGDDYLFYGCQKSLWVMIGDIRIGGGIFNRSREIGIVSRSAWCYGPEGEVLFLGANGLYWIEPTSTYPKNLSTSKVPAELVGLDQAVKTILMSFDSYASGVHIFAPDTTSSSASTHLWFDWFSGTFWLVTMPVGMEPTALVSYPEILSRSPVILGCRDGYLRSFADGNTDDDGEDLSSYVWIGPIRVGPVGYEGAIDEIIGVLDNSSGDVDWEIYVGESMEDALAATARTTGTWEAGPNHVVRTRERGHALFIKLASTSRWAIESIGMKLSAIGRLKPLT